MPIKIKQPKLYKVDLKDKYSRHRKIKLQQSMRMHDRDRLFQKDVMRSIALVKRMQELTIGDTYIDKHFIMDDRPHCVINRGLIVNIILKTNTKRYEYVHHFDLHDSGNVVPFVFVADRVFYPMLNNEQNITLANYIINEDIRQPNLQVGWLVAEVYEGSVHNSELKLITDKALILQGCPPPSISHGHGNANCPVCLECVGQGDQIFELPCKHEIHCICMNRLFLRGLKFCPLCKCNISLNL